MISKLNKLVCTLIVLNFIAANQAAAQSATHPDSQVITSVSFNMQTLVELAPGSDNWPVTWADDGHQYTSWGDGGGFGGTNTDGRVSMGVGRVEGPKDNYRVKNINGGKNPESGNAKWPDIAGRGGKCLGIISIDLSAHGGQAGTLYLYRNGTLNGNSAYRQTELYKSTDHGATWTYTGVRWVESEFSSSGFFSPSFLQFGQDYDGARDDYVYSYAANVHNNEWNIQRPGQITLMRVLKTQMEEKSSYQYFAGLDGNNQPTWTSNVNSRRPVFVDAANGVMRTSVSYNEPLRRYLLITQQVDRWREDDYYMGIYDAPEPWGPWTTVFFGNPRDDIRPSLNSGEKTVFWNFSNKWLSADGKNFVLVYTGPGPDNWGTVEGEFTVAVVVDPPSGLTATALSESRIDLHWADNSDNEDGFAIERREETGPVGPPAVTLIDYAGANTPPSVEAAGSANSFRSGALVVNDRSDTWTAVPAALANHARLLTARDDRMNSPVSGMYTVEVSGPGTIYLPLDPRYGGGKLSWMDASWTDSGMTCSSSALSGWKIWKKAITGPGQMVLGVDEAQHDGVAYVFGGSDGSPWTEIATVAADETSIEDEGLTASTTYSYRVRAFRGGISSAWSQVASATTFDEPGPDGGTDGGADEDPDGEPVEDGGTDGNDAADDTADDDEGPDEDVASDDDENSDGGDINGNGCSCRSEGPQAPSAGFALLLLAALVFSNIRRGWRMR